jgi:BED zinc finger
MEMEVEELSEEDEPSNADLKLRKSPIYKHFTNCNDKTKLKCKYCIKTLVVSRQMNIKI